MEQLLTLLENPDHREAALQGDDPAQVYVALWVLAFEDIERALAAAKPLWQDSRVEIRFVAAYLLRQIGVSEVVEAIAPSLADEDVRIAVQAFRATQNLSAGPLVANWFESLEMFLQRFPKKETKVEPLVWPWMDETIKHAEIACQLWRMKGTRSLERMIPYLPLLDPWAKLQVADQLIKQRPWPESVRAAIFDLIGDRSSRIREGVMSRLLREDYTPSVDEAQAFESFLTRKAADLRRGAISLLLKQADDSALASAQRLLAASKAPQRLAGLELLDQLQQTERMDCRQWAEAYAEKRPKRTSSEQELLDRLLASEQDVPTLADGLGLFDPSNRTAPACPQPPKNPIALVSDSTPLILQSLDELLVQHRTTPVHVQGYHDRQPVEQLLGNVYGFSRPSFKCSREENIQRLPLASVWQTWWEDRPQTMRDDDGLEILRAILSFPASYGRSWQNLYGIRVTGDPVELKRLAALGAEWTAPVDHLESKHVRHILGWLHYLYPPDNLADSLLQAAQFTVAELNAVMNVSEAIPYDWRINDLLVWLTKAREHLRACPEDWAPAQITQLWQLLCWCDEPQNESMVRYRLKPDVRGVVYEPTTDPNGFVQRQRPTLDEVLAAFSVGAATEADVYEHLLGERFMHAQFHDLRRLTRRKPDPLLKAFPALPEMVEACRDRILSVELTRGDLPTAATKPALALSSITGIPNVIRMLQNFGSEKFARGWLRDSQSKTSVFSHLFRASFPAESDTPAAFTQQVKAADISEQRLVDLAMYAPQWARYVEHALGWKDLAESVW